jgi:hypothetical protein
MFPLVAYRTGTSESRSELNGASNGTVVALFSRLLQRIIGRGAERATQFLVSGDTKTDPPGDTKTDPLLYT